MKFNLNYCVLYNDNFNVSNLIKKINPQYKLYFNQKDKVYFIVNSAKNNEICLKFYNFNQNVLKILQSSKVENSHKLFKEIDNFNYLTELKNKNSIIENTSQKIIELNNFSKRVNHLSQTTLTKIIGGDLC